MGVVTSKSKRDDIKSEQRKARLSKVGKRTSNMSKNSMVMTALDGVDCNWHNGDGTAVTGKDGPGTAGRRDAARAWTDVEESGGQEQNRGGGTMKGIGQHAGNVPQRSSWGEMKVYDVEPEAEMHPPRVTSVRQPEATGDVVVVTDVMSNHDNVVTTAAAYDDVIAVGKKTSTAVPPLQPLPEALRNRFVRIPTGGITTTGILSMPMTTTTIRVCHGDGLPDVECVARSNERRESIVESAQLLARCRPPDELLGKSSFANVSQNGNGATAGSLLALPKRAGLRPLPIPSACAYGCTYPTSSTSPAGDFRRRLAAGEGSGFVMAADGEHLHAPDRSCGAAAGGGCTLVVMRATTDVIGADEQHLTSVQCLHSKVTTLAQQSSKQMERMKDPGAWLVGEEEQLKETIKVTTKVEEMKADREVDEGLAEGRVAEQTVKSTRESSSYAAGEKPTEQMVEQLDQTAEQPQSILYSMKVCPPQGDATPVGQSLEESGTPKWTEAAEEGKGKEDFDEGLTEETAKEDVADSPEELCDMEEWYNRDVTLLHCTSQHPSANPRSSSRKNSGDPEARPIGNVTHESAELFGKVSADIYEHHSNGDAALIRGDVEQNSEKVTVVSGDCIHGDGEADASERDARLDHADADDENGGYSPELQHVLDRHCTPSTGMPAVRDSTLMTSVDRCLDASPIRNDSRNAPALWSDSEVAGNDAEIAWSDAWVTWSDTQAKDKDWEGDGKGGGEGGSGRADTFFDQAKPSKNRLS